MSTALSDSDVEGILLGSEDDLLVELLGVIEATRQRPMKMTRHGIPPKPYWNAINERIIWADPSSIVQGWDEVDQIRMLFQTAWALGLLAIDEEGTLYEGPNAESFFLASRLERASSLLRAFVRMKQWDERCDARNEEGYRYHFGRTFRRDFVLDTADLRLAILEGIEKEKGKGWQSVHVLAETVYCSTPNIVSVEDKTSPFDAAHTRAEITRLVGYWLFIASRLGVVDLARTPGEGDPDERRLFRVTALGDEILPHGWVGTEALRDDRQDRRPWLIQPTLDVLYYRADGDIGDEYLLRRICAIAPPPKLFEPTASYKIDKVQLEQALELGMDPLTVQHLIFDRSRAAVPQTVQILLDDALRAGHPVTIQRGLTLLEFAELSDELAAKLSEAGFHIARPFVIVPPHGWTAFVELYGREPTEAFLYPSEYELAKLKGDRFSLLWEHPPLTSRDLLVELDAAQSDKGVELNAAKLKELAAAGFPKAAVADALLPLTGGALPKSLKLGKK